jgi:NAD-dependent dihydropyrimidine dehydrogenase PreA subunit
MINPANFIAKVNNATCRLCGTCVKRCPVNAISIIKGKTTVNRRVCLGCGVCTRFCPIKSIKLESRPRKNYVPKTINQRVILQALNQGKIGNFIFDNQTSFRHLILRNLINLFVKFPPLKWFFTNRFIFGIMLRIIRKVYPQIA